MSVGATPHFQWLDTRTSPEELVEFFLEHAPPEYISHGELQDGRASDVGMWSRELRAILTEQFALALTGRSDGVHGETRLAVARLSEGALVCVAYIGIERSTALPYAVIYDLLVRADARGAGVGSSAIEWLEKQLSETGVRRLFLESGMRNERAHSFFHKIGYQPVSVTFMKKLPA